MSLNIGHGWYWSGQRQRLRSDWPRKVWHCALIGWVVTSVLCTVALVTSSESRVQAGCTKSQSASNTLTHHTHSLHLLECCKCRCITPIHYFYNKLLSFWWGLLITGDCRRRCSALHTRGGRQTPGQTSVTESRVDQWTLRRDSVANYSFCHFIWSSSAVCMNCMD